MYLRPVWKYPKYSKPFPASMENIQTRSMKTGALPMNCCPELKSQFLQNSAYRKHVKGHWPSVECNAFEPTAHRLLRQQLLAVYQIIQEQHTNIIKYSSHPNVFMSTANSNFRLIIADDGTGADLIKQKVSGLKRRKPYQCFGKVKVKTRP